MNLRGVIVLAATLVACQRVEPAADRPPGDLRGKRTGAASDVEDPAAERESGEIGEGHRQRPREAAHEPVISLGIVEAHYFFFRGNAWAKRSPLTPTAM